MHIEALRDTGNRTVPPPSGLEGSSLHTTARRMNYVACITVTRQSPDDAGVRARPARAPSVQPDPAPEVADAVHRDGDWRLVPTCANRMPTAASYLRRPGDSEFRAFKFDVLRIEDGAIAEITTFGAALFPVFGLSPTL